MFFHFKIIGAGGSTDLERFNNILLASDHLNIVFEACFTEGFIKRTGLKIIKLFLFLFLFLILIFLL
jgi:hypothetical protein